MTDLQIECINLSSAEEQQLAKFSASVLHMDASDIQFHLEDLIQKSEMFNYVAITFDPYFGFFLQRFSSDYELYKLTNPEDFI